MNRVYKEASLQVRRARVLYLLATPRGKRRFIFITILSFIIFGVFFALTLPGSYTSNLHWTPFPSSTTTTSNTINDSDSMTPADVKSLEQVAHADPRALQECLAQWTISHTNNNITNKNQINPFNNNSPAITTKNTAIDEILEITSSGAVNNDNSRDDAQAISNRARGKLNNPKANAQSVNQAHAIVKDVEREIASVIKPSSSSTSSTDDTSNEKLTSTTTTTTTTASSITTPKEIKFPGSSVGITHTYGTPIFGYLGRERGNFERINDHTAPRSELLRRRRGLLAVPVSGDAKQQLAPVLATFRQEKFDIMLFHYDLADWSDVPYYDETISIRVQGQTKFWFAKRFLVPELMENYDYIFLWDDDVGLKSDWSPTKFVSILQHFNIHAAQPALGQGARNNYPQYETVRLHQDVVDAGLPGRFADFVEVMFPVFSREAWQNCIWETIPYDGRSFWGVDNAWYPHCSSMGYCRFAVIDAMPVDHLDRRSLYQPAQNNMREFGFYTKLYRNMCSTKPSDVDRSTMFRIFVICNFLRRRPLGWSFRSLMSIEHDVHGGSIMNSTTCPEPTLWPKITNRPWYGDQPPKPVPYQLTDINEGEEEVMDQDIDKEKDVNKKKLSSDNEAVSNDTQSSDQVINNKDEQNDTNQTNELTSVSNDKESQSNNDNNNSTELESTDNNNNNENESSSNKPDVNDMK